MKTKKYTLMLITFLMITQVNATIWRINNTPGADANYSTIVAAVAHGTVTNGDTLFIEGSAVAYGGFTTAKSLVYIGPGYFLDENPETQANFTAARITGTVTLNNGSAGSVMTGLYFYNLSLNDDNIVIKRNRFSYLSLGSGIVNIIVKKNYFSNYLTVGTNCQNIIISNNYIDGGSAGSTVISSSSTSALTVDHNVILGRITAYNSVFSNNIIVEGSAWTVEKSIYFNNIANEAQFGNENNNQWYVDMADVFVGATDNSTDGQWQLKTGSPAIGTDSEGGDCGMFGGISPYILSGVPSLPAIYHFYSTSEASNETGLRIQVKAKTRE